jgi:hypothetical protein
MRLFLVLAAAATLASARPVSADSPPPPQTDRDRSSETAMYLSLGVTTLSLSTLFYASRATSGTPSTPLQVIGVVGLAGLVAGPSAGHIYAGEYGHAAVTTVLRGGALAAVLVGVTRITTTSLCDGPCGTDDKKRNGGIMAIAGAATYVLSTAYDLIDAPRSVKRRHRERARSTRLAPSVVTDASGSISPAIGVSGLW